MLKTVILCGGQGTRIRDVSEVIPKPMLDIGGRPILWHIMKIYASFGVKEFILCLGYRGNVIKEYFLNYYSTNNDFTIDLSSQEKQFYKNNKLENWSVTLADTGLGSLTGSRVKRIQKYIGKEDFFLTYGDGVADINILDLYNYHREKGKTLTMSAVRPPSRFGEMIIDDKNIITSFEEKPQSVEGCINGGFFVCNNSFFDHLKEDESCILEREPIQNLTKNKEMVAYKHNGFWQCMDTSREYILLNKLWSENNAPWKVWEDD